MSVEFRQLVVEDLPTLVEEYERTWGVAQQVGSQASLALSRHFVLHYLAPSTQGLLAHDGDRFLGLLIGRVFGDEVLFPEAYDWLREHDEQMKQQEDVRYAQALEGAHRMRSIEISLEAKSHINDLTQAELELFLVSPQARGLGVGGGLWRRTMRALRSRGVNRYYLHTDTACDVSFYDYHGLTQDAAWFNKDHPHDERQVNLVDDLFIYSGEPMVKTKRSA